MSRYLNRIVVGVDIASEFSFATILNKDGTILKKSFRINHNAESFEFLHNMLLEIEKQHNDRPSIFLESTGIYHLPLSIYFKKLNYEVNLINPLVINSNKNFDIRKVKNDKNDSFKIANISKHQNIKFSKIMDEDVYIVRSLIRGYYNIVDEIAKNKLKLSSELKLIYPGYSSVFSDITGVSSLKVLSLYSTPNEFIEADRANVVELIATASRSGLNWAESKYDKLYACSKKALKLMIKKSTCMIKIFITTIEFLNEKLKILYDEIISHINKDNFPKYYRDNVNLLESIPGVGFISAIAILFEIGDFSKYPSHKQLIAFFGIDPSVTESGNFKGTRNKISKRGTRVGRRALFAIALSSIRKSSTGKEVNAVLRNYYLKKTKSKEKKVALVAIMNKLVRYIFSVLKGQKPYQIRTPEEHISKYLSLKATNN